MSKLIYVLSSDGDWSGIYIDGKLDYEGHSIPAWVWMDCINLASLTEACSFEVDGLWLEEYGSFPLTFEDIPKDQFK